MTITLEPGNDWCSIFYDGETAEPFGQQVLSRNGSCVRSDDGDTLGRQKFAVLYSPTIAPKPGQWQRSAHRKVVRGYMPRVAGDDSEIF